MNPASGQHDPETIRRQLESRLEAAGAHYEIRVTEGEGDALRWAREADDLDLIVVSGGDGTVMEALSGVIGADHRTPLAQLPAGTANLLALALGIPTDVDEAIEVALNGVCVDMDVGYLPERDRYFTLVAGAGWDANLIEDATREIKDRLGFFAYILTGIKNLFTLRRARVRVEIDGEKRSFVAHTVMVLNVGEILGSGVKLGDDLNPHDGKLNLAIVSPTSPLGILKLTLRLITRRFDNYRDLQYFAADRVHIETTPPLKLQIDGEPIGTTPFHAEVIPGGATLVVPAEYAEQKGLEGRASARARS